MIVSGIHVIFFFSQKFEFSIRTTWDGQPIDHQPVKFTVNAVNDDSVKVDVKGSFFNDPGAPSVPPGNPCPELWEYEGRVTESLLSFKSGSIFGAEMPLV